MSEPICSWCGHKKSEHGRVTSACLVANCQCYEWHNPPTAPAPTTGTTEQRLIVHLARTCDQCGGKGALPDRYGPSDCPTCLGTGTRLDEAKDYIAVPAAAVPDAELVAAVGRMVEISQLAQALLFMHGSFGQPWPDDDLGNRLTVALEAITLPHDWERLAAWLAAHEEDIDGH